ncbi:MAG: hypothetical protein J2O46_10925, partial [Nocardioides sp.]|nr:hypothetical protein [Nocardioides sp.]
WVAVVLTPLTLAVAAYVAARSARTTPLPGIGLWAAAQLAVVPLLVLGSGLHLSAQALGIDATGGFGAIGWEAMLLLTAYAVVIGALVLLAKRVPIVTRVTDGARQMPQKSHP